MVLQEVGKGISNNVREGDTVARWGGEESVGSPLGANENDAKNKAEEIRKNIESLIFSENHVLKVTISIGVATKFKEAKCADLLKNADLALYRAKRDGRNRVVAFSEL